MISDQQLQQAVTAELAWEPSLDASHIGVVVNDGVVTLSGHVPSFAQKLAAETAAGRVGGVKAVVQSLNVEVPSSTQRTDDEIAAAAVARLATDVSVPMGAVSFAVENGVATLYGEVDWHYQKEAAEQNLRHIPGVVAVLNEIVIRPKVDAPHLQDDIMHALHRSWFFDPDTIQVTASNGAVRLAGIVRSPHERQVAAATAWSAPGVTDVENDLTIA